MNGLDMGQFSRLLDLKYAQQGQQVAAQAAQNYAQANLQNQQAGMVRTLGIAEAAQRNAAANLSNTQAGVLPGVSNSEIRRNNSASDYTDMQTSLYRPLTLSQINENNSRSGLLGEQTRMYEPLTKSQINQNNASAEYNQSEADKNNAKVGKYKRGIARVPGKGSGDKIMAMLEPGEAVVNRKAAGMIGRDKIAKANAKGNQMRQQEDRSKLAAFLKKMSSGMV